MNISNRIFRKQSGIALIIFLTVVVLGTATFLVSQANNSRFQREINAQKQTAKVLRQAKEALLGFAAVYAEIHDSQRIQQGFLPCPDHDGSGSDPVCGTAGKSMIGRFPWKVLGLPVLRDGYGECLWYAVSGSYKDNPKQEPLITGDTDGLFIVENNNGDRIAGKGTGAIQEMDQAIAIIFSVGKAITRNDGKRQNRVINSNTECGSNVQVNDYLDILNSIDNANVDETDNKTLAEIPTTFIKSSIIKDSTGEEIFNDTLMLITPEDFEPIYKRMEQWITKFVALCLDEYNRDYLDKYKINYYDLIQDYKDVYEDEINDYVDYYATDWKDDWIAEYNDDPTSHPTSEPTATEITAKEDEIRNKTETVVDEDDIVVDEDGTKHPKEYHIEKYFNFTGKFPWPADLDSYDNDVNILFGRIPDSIANSHSVNSNMTTNSYPNWKEVKVAGTSCFDYKSIPANTNWEWWEIWRDKIFYALNANNQPSIPAYIWIDWPLTKEDTATKEGTWGTIIDGVLITNKNEPTSIYKPSATTPLQLNGKNVEKLVIVAGGKLVLNQGTINEYIQIRNTDEQKMDIDNYLENENSDEDEAFEYKSVTPDFNDFICEHRFGCSTLN